MAIDTLLSSVQFSRSVVSDSLRPMNRSTPGLPVHHQLPLSAIRMVLSAYLRLLMFFPATLIPACASSSPAFLMIYSPYKLNKQADNIQPWRTPFLIWNQSIVPCPVLTVASWSAYRFLRRQVRWSGITISLRIFRSLLWNHFLLQNLLKVMCSKIMSSNKDMLKIWRSIIKGMT